MVFAKSTFQAIAALLAATSLVACGNASVTGLVESQVSGSISATFWVNDVAPGFAKPGQSITLSGFGFDNNVAASVGNVAAQVAGVGDQLIVTIPAGVAGISTLSLRRGDETMSMPFIVLDDSGRALIAADSSTVCAGESFTTPAGVVQTGSKQCGTAQLQECDAEGATGCVATTKFPAVDTGTLQDRVVLGATVAGVSGQGESPGPALCATDGQLECLTSAPFPAAKKNGFTSVDIRDGVTIAGVLGTLPTSMPVGCTSNFEEGCITTTLMPAIDPTNLTAANIRADVVIAGITGLYPSAAHPLDDSTAATADLESLAANVAAGSYEWFTSHGELRTGTISDAGTINVDGSTQTYNASVYRQFSVPGSANLVEANIKAGVNIYGKIGTLIEAPGNCTTNFDDNCVVSGTWRAIDPTNLVEENIKRNVTIAGLTGTYPSAGNPLTDASGTADLPSLAHNVAAGLYEWFNSEGVRLTGSISDAGTLQVGTANQVFSTSVYRGFTLAGEPALTVGNVRNGVSIGPVIGEYPSSTYPLPGASATTDLGSIASGISPGAYEWYGSDGSYRSGNFVDAGTIVPTQTQQSFGNAVYASFAVAGDGDLSANNVRKGFDLFGVAGTFTDAAPTCNFDGDSSCTVDGINYKATLASHLSSNAIVMDMHIGGVLGTNTNDPVIQIKSPVQPIWMSTTGAFTIQYDVTYSGGLTGEVRLYHKQLDANGCDAAPWLNGWTTIAAGLPRNSTTYATSIGTAGNYYICAVYYEDTVARAWDANGRIDVASAPGKCHVSDANWSSSANGCRKVSPGAAQGLDWSRGSAQLINWFAAKAYCEDLVEAGASDWRLPLVAELSDAHAGGAVGRLRMIASYHWSAEDHPGSPVTSAREINFSDGALSEYSKASVSDFVICVRGP